MKKVVLVDSCCNLPPDVFDQYQESLSMISMPVHIGNMDFLDDHGKTMSHKDFYDALRQGNLPKTSQITPTHFYDYFEKLYLEGKEILYISFSSGMSGTYSNSVIARDMFLEDHPDAVILLVDSHAASVGYGALVLKALESLETLSLEAIADAVERERFNVHHVFSVSDLMFLKNGGRIPPALATVGTLLNLKPIMDIDLAGRLRQKNKVRGKSKLYQHFIAVIKDRYLPEKSAIHIGHGDCEADARELADLIEKTLGYDQIIINPESPTIGSHVGPGMLVVSFLGNERA
ncbi:MAG: hypothetical protein AVO33_09425 [delta proteobacterium ML8_F1]|nr:MAG: hypothetical protein AVO33_09425 [delta proteobacterium ML8_F1]